MTGAVGFALDVTEWRRGRETRATHELVLENAHEAIAIGQDGRFVFCNAKTRRSRATRRAELASLSFAGPAAPRGSTPGCSSATGSGREGESIAPYSFRVLRKDGGDPLRGGEGHGPLDLAGAPGHPHLLQRRHRREVAQRALRESERFKERVADATPGILYIYDLEERRQRLRQPRDDRDPGLPPRKTSRRCT